MRLIDADALEKNLSNDLPYKGSVKRVLIQAPTVDAVEVVRCKNCIHKHEYTEYLLYCFHHGMTKKYDDFCSYGERRGD